MHNRILKHRITPAKASRRDDNPLFGSKTIITSGLRRLGCGMLGLTLLITGSARADTTIYCHKERRADGSCDVPLAPDGAIFKIVANVGTDAVPGDYVYDLGPSGPYAGFPGEIVVRVNNDGTWGFIGGVDTFGGNLQAQCSGGSESAITACNMSPAGSAHDENGCYALINFGSLCDDRTGGDGYLIPFNVTIGSAAADANQTKLCDANTACPAKQPMASYSIHLLLASLHIEDTPVSYRAARGPSTDFTVVYNQREANQPTTFPFSNLGPKWTHTWLSYVTDDPVNPTANSNVYVRGGGTETYSGFNGTTQSYAADPQSLALLVRTSGTSYERWFPDGSKEVFSASDGSTSYPRRIYLTSVVDAAGNATSLTYDGSLRLTNITDCLGQSTVLAYELPSDSLKITKVTDPFGRFASFEYTSGQLTKITDPVGIQSQFAYDTGSDFINSMTTPYGTTSFTKGESGNKLRWIEATDPMGGKERVEYNNAAPNIASTETSAPAGVYNGNLQGQNTFYWNKKAMADAPGDYTKAQVIHWLKSADGNSVSGIKHSEKQALESRVWYTYAGQVPDGKVGINALPISRARILDDGSTQLFQYEYNGLGNLTKETDPVGRVFSYIYASNGIDLLEKRQMPGTNNELLASYTYNSPIAHVPDTATDAARETTTFNYNSYGQITTITNAKNETTTFVYDRDQNADGVTDGYLLSVTGAVAGSTTTYHYDAAKRVDTVTDPENYVLTFGYDNIDRVTSVTYPDASSKQFKYTKFTNGVDTGVMTLDLGASKDRRGHWAYREYNANRQVTKVTDPLGHNTSFDWCSCGALNSITDGNNHTTSFGRDVQSRVTSKTFSATTLPAPGAPARSIIYTYENKTSRLKTVTDPRSQATNYSYFADDDLQQVSFTNAVITTPSVNFTYDPNYNRVATMVDGTGTTTYAYNPITGSVSPGAGQLLSIDGPLVNDTISYTYDELGRQLSTAVNGVAASQTYDALGRLGTVTNPLGTFTNSYLSSVSRRLQSTTVPNGPTITYSYFSNSADKRLQTIQNNTSGGVLLSKFDYTYDADGEILTWTRKFGTSNGILWSNGAASMNDAADRLTNVIERDAVTQALRTTYSFGYDNAGNQTTDGGATYSVNEVNQIVNSGYVYDANGNLTSDPFRTYEWDADNRLTAINYPNIPSARTEFTYDGLSRRVKIVEKGLAAPAITLSMQPAGRSYVVYTSGSVSLTAGTYKLTLAGLNPNGGDNTALIDAVKLNGVLVTNGGFETPAIAANSTVYNPSGATWTFTGTTGISRKKSTFIGNVAPPEGSQVGFVEMSGSISQNLSLAAGNYTLSVTASQANGNPSLQQVQATLQNTAQVVTNTKQFVWNNTSIVEERDAGNNVTRRFYAQGEQISGANYFYTRDQLGSVRELLDSSAAIRARYDYDPFGVRTKMSGDLDASFAFTGHYYHQPSGLNFTLYRGYDATTARWIARDPIGENGGINLYTYCFNDSIRLQDPLGTDSYWHDVQDTMAGFIGGLIPGLPYDPKNEAMRCGMEIGIGTGLVIGADGIISSGMRATARLTQELVALNSIRTLLVDEMAILRSAAEGSSNFGLGTASAADADRLGRAWVGRGFRVASDGKTLVSENGLRVYRPPSYKPRLNRCQANFEKKTEIGGPPYSNGHLDIE